MQLYIYLYIFWEIFTVFAASRTQTFDTILVFFISLLRKCRKYVHKWHVQLLIRVWKFSRASFHSFVPKLSWFFSRLHTILTRASEVSACFPASLWDSYVVTFGMSDVTMRLKVVLKLGSYKTCMESPRHQKTSTRSSNNQWDAFHMSWIIPQ